MNVQDAAYATAHDYPGGVPALAVRMGVSRNVLQNKLNPSVEYHKLTLDEAMRLQALTGDHRILNAMADQVGYVCIKLPEFEGVADVELLDAYMQIVADAGAFANDFRDALADRAITRQEYELLRDDLHKQQAHELELLARIESLIEE